MWWDFSSSLREPASLVGASWGGFPGARALFVWWVHLVTWHPGALVFSLLDRNEALCRRFKVTRRAPAHARNRTTGRDTTGHCRPLPGPGRPRRSVGLGL